MPPPITPVLLCGGSGTRLWPLSRKAHPKQFTNLIGAQTLFQASAKRFSGPDFEAPIIVTGNDFRFIVMEQMAAVNQMPAQVLIEPEARNTAPAILAAAMMLAKHDPHALMLVAPSDHDIPDTDAFAASVKAAAPRALAGDIVTFGIAPRRAETGYGWLELAPASDATASEPQALARFVEKPNTERAEEMLSDGGFLWNAGIFLFRAQTLIDAFAHHAPHILTGVTAAVEHATADLSFTRLDPTAWADLEDISIDYAIMEKAGNLSVMPFTGDWSDLGGWDAVWAQGQPDAEGTVVSGTAHAIDCRDSLLFSSSERVQLVGIGLEGLVAVATSDAVLVVRKDSAQDVKKAVALLKERQIMQAEAFPMDRRPWGMFESLVTGTRFQVKRIVVKPGAALSLQSHHHRSEHWVVVEGTARVTIDDTVQLVTENQSVYIPLGATHRMENPGKLPLTLIEVQTGAYLGEDDIVRYEDIYARGQGAKG